MQDPDLIEIILHNLDFFREGGHQKHLRDIAGVINQQKLDLELLATATAKLRLEQEWQAALMLASR